MALVKIKKNKKIKDENWIAKALNKRKAMPIIIAVVISCIVLSGLLVNGFFEFQTIKKQKTDMQDKIESIKQQIQNVENKTKTQQTQIEILSGLTVDAKRPAQIYGQVCEFMKKKDVIGAYYIKKSQNKEFANVLDIDIQVSYGDKNLLFVVIKMFSDALFYTKSITKTKLGVKVELYKPKK